MKVPKESRPRDYHGQVTIAAKGLRPVSVPVSVKVLDWALPDPQHFRTWVELIQSPDTLSVEYEIPPWSDRHRDMIARSMDFVSELGGKPLYVPLIAQSNVGNEHSMVRWIKKGEGRYDYDFSIMDRYLDLAERHMGRPEVVVFNVWDRYLTRKGSRGRGFQKEAGMRVAKDGPIITLLDPATGKTSNEVLADYPNPTSKALWKSLFDQIRERMETRGLEKAMMLGMVSDFWSSKEQTEALKEISSDLPWVNAAHSPQKSLHGIARLGYQTTYFGARFGYLKSLCGWKSSDLSTMFECTPLDTYPLAKWRCLAEQAVTGNCRGPGRLGADTWPAVKDGRGRRAFRVWQRYRGGDWGYLNCNSSTLAPGPDGPVATARFEMLREGVQESEARILIEEALTDNSLKGRLGANLAAECEAALDERRECMWKGLGLWQSGADYDHEATSWRERGCVTGYTWFLGSRWQERSEELYRLAGRVQEKLAAR